MSHYFKKYFVFFLFVISFTAGAQTYPVKVTTTLTPPYSLSITDYGSSVYNKISAAIFMADLTQINYMAKARLLIKGPNNIVLRTRPGKEIGPLFLNGGQTELLTGAELSSLFDLANIDFLSGLSYSQYIKDGLLPEGVYQFSIEVMDYNNNAVVVSDPNFGIATGWLILNDPPLINMPMDKSTIESLEPKNIFFQWTPRHTGSPNSAFGVVYDIQMVEIYPADRNPNDAMLTSPVIFEQTVFSTSYNYTLVDPSLVAGNWYAFRVRVRTNNNLDLFKNQGFSQVHSFYYGKPCAVPSTVKIDPIDATSALFFWDNQPSHLSTEVQYKEKNAASWSSVTSYSNTATLSTLKPGKTYLVRLSGRCSSNTSDYTEELIYTTGIASSGKECDLPFLEEVTATAKTLSSVGVSWLTEKWFDRYTFRDRLLSESGFTEVESKEAAITLQNLDVDKIYEYQLRYHCITDVWVEGNFNTFKITVPDGILTSGGTGDCFPPLDITHAVQDDLTVDISWPKDKEVDSYTVYWKEDVAATSWDSVTVSSEKVTLKNLKADTDYLYLIKAICKKGGMSIASATNKFNTSARIGNGKNCVAPELLPFTILSSEEVKLEWKPDTTHTSYVMEYREQNTSYWLASKSTTPFQLVSSLDNSKKYEYHVYAFCGTTSSDFSSVDTFSTSGKKEEPFVCGSSNGVLDITNRTPIASLRVGDKFTAAKFEIEVKSLTSSAPYNGEATARIPYLKNSSFVFGMVDVQVNELKQMYAGTIYLKKANLSVVDPKFAADIMKMLDFVDQGFTYFEEYLTAIDKLQDDINGYISKAEGGNKVGKVVTGEVEITKTLTIAVSDASQLKGSGSGGSCSIAITGDDGTKQSVSVKAPATIQDSQGIIYAIDANCNALKVAEQISLDKTPAQLDVLSSDAVVTFVDYSGKQKLGFSAWDKEYAKSPEDWAIRYEELTNSYRVPSKYTEPASADVVKATITSSIDKSKVIFVSGKGIKYVSKLVGNDFEITVLGAPHGDAQELYALYPEGDSYKSFGKLLLPSYKPMKRSLVLVPVNGASVPQAEIEKKLNTIYNSYGVSWEVTTDANFSDMTWDVNGDKNLSVDGSGTFSTLTDEMKALNIVYSTSRKILPTNIYLFVLNKAETAGVDGDMPRAKQFGYLFTEGNSKNEIARTAAHEVGHGLFLLRHTFDGYNMAQKALPENLMDYAGGENLAKLQWDVMHDPGIVLGVFEKDEDAQQQVVNSYKSLSSLVNADKKTITFITPAGRPFTLLFSEIREVVFSLDDLAKGTISDPYYPNGSLLGFTLTKDGKTMKVYTAYKNGSQFTGYKETNTGVAYLDPYSKSTDLQNAKLVCVGLPVISKGEFIFNVKKAPYDDDLLNIYDNWPTVDHNGTGEFVGDLDVKDNKAKVIQPFSYRKTNEEDKLFLSNNNGETNSTILRSLKAASDYILLNSNSYIYYSDCSGGILGYYSYQAQNTYTSSSTMISSCSVCNPKSYASYVDQFKVSMVDYKKAIKPKASDWHIKLSDLLLKEKVTQNELLLHLKKIKCLDQNFVTVYKSLSVEERVNSLKILSSGTMLGSWFGLASNEESYAINLAEYINDGDINLFFDELIRSAIFSTLYNAIDGENSERFLATLTNKYYKSAYYQTDVRDLTDENTFVFNGYDWHKGVNYIFIVEGNGYEVTKNIDGYLGLKKFTVDAFSTISLVSKVSLPYIKSNNVLGKFFMAKVPAFYLKMLLDKASRNSSVQLAGITIVVAANAFTFGVGGTLLSSASTTVRVIGALDMITASIGTGMIAVKPIFEAKYGIGSTQYKVAENIDKIVMFYNFGRLATDLVQLPKLLDDGANLWKLEREVIKNDGALSAKQIDELDELYRYSDDLIRVVDDLTIFLETLKRLGLKRLSTEVSAMDKVIQSRFLSDFSSVTDDVLIVLDKNEALLPLWKSFANEQSLGPIMRARYIRDLATLSDANIDVLKSILVIRKNLSVGLGVDDLAALGNSNIGFATVTYKVDGQIKTIKLLSISGDVPANTLIKNLGGKYGDFIIVPKPSGKRYFSFTESSKAQDSEAKMIELIMEKIRFEKTGKALGNTDIPANFIDDILKDSNIEIQMTSEMKHCRSCASILDDFNKRNGSFLNNEIIFNYGTLYE